MSPQPCDDNMFLFPSRALAGSLGVEFALTDVCKSSSCGASHTGACNHPQWVSSSMNHHLHSSSASHLASFGPTPWPAGWSIWNYKDKGEGGDRRPVHIKDVLCLRCQCTMLLNWSTLPRDPNPRRKTRWPWGHHLRQCSQPKAASGMGTPGTPRGRCPVGSTNRACTVHVSPRAVACIGNLAAHLTLCTSLHATFLSHSLLCRPGTSQILWSPHLATPASPGTNRTAELCLAHFITGTVLWRQPKVT